jgi:hypothetical protein
VPFGHDGTDFAIRIIRNANNTGETWRTGTPA